MIDQYAIPSAFGLGKRRVENYYIVREDDYYNRIVGLIE